MSAIDGPIGGMMRSRLLMWCLLLGPLACVTGPAETIAIVTFDDAELELTADGSPEGWITFSLTNGGTEEIWVTRSYPPRVQLLLPDGSWRNVSSTTTILVPRDDTPVPAGESLTERIRVPSSSTGVRELWTEPFEGEYRVEVSIVPPAAGQRFLNFHSASFHLDPPDG